MKVVARDVVDLARPPATEPKTAETVTLRTAEPAHVRARHRVALIGFLLFVLLPVAGSGYYLYRVAVDQYASYFAFSVQREDVSSTIELLGGSALLSGSSSSDTDILADFITSRELVQRVNGRLDLRRIYTVEKDPLFSLPAEPTVEDLHNHWKRKVRVFYDPRSGLIRVRVLAFGPNDALAIAKAIFDQSSETINAMSATARADAIRYARQSLDRAASHLKQARRKMTVFRAQRQIIDPKEDIAARMELLAGLRAQLAETKIELAILRETTRPSDPRIAKTSRRQRILEARISDERQRFSQSPNGQDSDYSTLVAEYEGLAVDLEFAEQAYTSALGSFEAARANAQRQTRYLAAYQEPTLAESAEYPERLKLLSLIAGFSLLGWAIITLVFYAIRDRR